MKRFISRFLVSFGLTMSLLASSTFLANAADTGTEFGTLGACVSNAACSQRFPCPFALLGHSCGFHPAIIPDPNDPHLLVCRCG